MLLSVGLHAHNGRVALVYSIRFFQQRPRSLQSHGAAIVALSSVDIRAASNKADIADMHFVA